MRLIVVCWLLTFCLFYYSPEYLDTGMQTEGACGPVLLIHCDSTQTEEKNEEVSGNEK
jgi:hypothetical protein